MRQVHPNFAAPVEAPIARLLADLCPGRPATEHDCYVN
jgi:hypothetical protein